MFAIIVTEKGGDQRRLEFDKSEVTIGRVQGNDVILPKGNVSKRHARIVLKDGKFIIVDLKSTNGTYVNGRKITSPLVVKENDKIYIGDFILGVEESAQMPAGFGAPAPPEPQPPAPPPPSPPMPAPDPMRGMGHVPAPMGPEPVPQRGPSVEPPPAPRPTGRPHVVPPSPLPSEPSPVPPRPGPRTRPPKPAPVPSRAPAPEPPGPPAVAPGMPSRPQRLVGAGARAAHQEVPHPPEPARVPPRRPVPEPRPTAPAPRATAAMPTRGVHVPPLDASAVKTLEIQQSILERVVARLDLDNMPLERLGEEDLWQKTESAIVDLVETLESSGELPDFVDQDALIKEALNEALGLGPLEDLLADQDVDEIIVDRRDRIIVAHGELLSGSGRAFSSDAAFRRVVERLVAPTGYAIGEETPLVDVRLRDGSRLAAAVPPVAVRGACLTLRKPKPRGYSLAELVGQGSLSGEMGDFLNTCIAARRNMLICGAPGSGKSALLAALAAAAPDGERIVSVEEVAELALDRDDWIALEARPSSSNGLSAVDLQAVLRGALRMRPDRLVVGDVRGGEALELISAMSSSHDGTIASIAGDGAQAALDRLTAMARLAAPGVSLEALREIAAAAVHVIVHMARYADGVFRIASVGEVRGVSVDGFDTQEIFSFRGTSGEGGFAAAGVIPAFYADLEARGLPADTTIFRT